MIESRVATQAEKLMEFMEQHDGKPFDPAECLMRSVADVICGITFNNGSDTTNPDLNRLLELCKSAFANTDDFQTSSVLDFFPWARYLPIKAYGRFIQPFLEIHGVIRKLLREAERAFDPAVPVEDFISALLRAKHDLEAECGSEEERAALLSEDRLVMTIEDMFIAGYETTSTTLKWVMAFLANFPKYQEDIQRQLDEVVGDRRPSLGDRQNLPLIQATIMETLRVGNVLPLALPHVTVTNTTLCGYRVPKDTFVIANTESVHLDPKCWEDPTVFNPYRHIDSDGNLVTNQGNFYPFGAGRRVCAGEPLAKVELFMFVSRLFHNFTFVPEDGHPPKGMECFVRFPTRYTVRAIKRKF